MLLKIYEINKQAQYQVTFKKKYINMDLAITIVIFALTIWYTITYLVYDYILFKKPKYIKKINLNELHKSDVLNDIVNTINISYKKKRIKKKKVIKNKVKINKTKQIPVITTPNTTIDLNWSN